MAPLEVAADFSAQIAHVLEWADACWAADSNQPLLVYSTAGPAEVQTVQQRLGVLEAGALIERALSAVALGLVERGAGQLILAGGETAGACVHALGVHQLQIGPQIDPGVPWCYALSSATRLKGLHLALKSGNFGSTDFFTKSFELLA